MRVIHTANKPGDGSVLSDSS